MKILVYIVLFSALTMTILSCDRPAEETGTIISGKINTSKSSKTIYLNQINHFDNLSDNYTIDSTFVSENGEFEFKKNNLNSKLVSIATSRFKPYTYQAYSTAPQTYFYGNCEKFFTAIPTFYITDEKSLTINWTQTQSIDSISSPDNTAFRQVKLRAFYLNSNKIDVSTLDYENKLDYKVNWEQMLLERVFDLKIVNWDAIEIESSFDNFLYSEIYLGHLNKFLNWFEANFPEKVENSLENPKSGGFYASIFSVYNEHKWNSKSLEYYKFTERYVNYHMNLEAQSFANYYPSTQNKRTLAKKILSGTNKERYLNLIDKQIKKAL
jgi:hypothetical protein